MSGDERFDALLMNIAQQQRGIEPLLDSVFSFLRRKTDFFSGADQAVVEATVLQSVRKQAALAEKDRYLKRQEEDKQRKLREKRAAEEKLKKLKESEQKAKMAAAAAGEAPRFEEVTDEEAEKIQKTPVPEPTEVKPEASASDVKDAAEDDDTPPPEGNGGRTDKYVWTQTLQEAQVNFEVPSGTKSRQVAVEITASRLKVGLRGGETFVDGPLFNRVKVDDSFWTLEDGNRVCVYLQKENQMEWWKTVIQGDAEINTQKVQPENSKLSDLDADTRQTVEKMMFDQRQKALGLPSSDDMQKQDILHKFMAQHPEMDFSKAKVN